MNMTFSLPEIQIPSRVYDTFKIVFLVGGFVIIAMNVLLSGVSALPPNTTNDDKYQFVKCPDDNNTYPEGTVCEFTDDNLEEGEEKEDEQEHEEESDEQE